MAMNDRIRASDADRERVTARLREHFAEGRLTREELDERVAAALSAKTMGDLRGLMTDLPGESPATPPVVMRGPVLVRRRGPGILPLAFLVLLAAVLIPGGAFVVLALFQVLLVVALVAVAGALFAAHRFRRRMRRHWQAGQVRYRAWDWPARG
jgi:hypothetical protein